MGHPPTFVIMDTTRAEVLRLPMQTGTHPVDTTRPGLSIAMPRQPEGKLVANARRLILLKGGRPFKIQGDAENFQEVGIPDLLVCYKGRFIGLEAKMPGNYASPKQKAVLDEIVEAGGYGVVFTTQEQVSRLLAKIDREVARGKTSANRYYRYDLDSTYRRER